MDEQHVLSQIHTLFDSKVKYLHLGCPDDFHPKSTGFKERMREVLSILSAAGIRKEAIPAAPRLQFTNIVVDVKDCKEYVLENENGLYRTKNFADGTVIREPGMPAAIFNADCHIGILYHFKTHRLALIHLGLKCFYREDGSPDIIWQAIRALDKPPTYELQFWFGVGIGACCNGYDHSDPKNAALGKKLNEEIGHHFPVVGHNDNFGNPSRAVLYGPRAGQVTYDNVQMISNVARKHKISQVFPAICTCCQGREQHPKLPQMWSHVRGHQQRNLFLAWLA